MRPIEIDFSFATTGDVSAPAVVSYRQPTFNVGIAVLVASDPHSVQQCFQDPEDFDNAADYNATGIWFDVEDDALVGKSGNIKGNIRTPCQAFRVKAGSIAVRTGKLIVIQGN